MFQMSMLMEPAAWKYFPKQDTEDLPKSCLLDTIPDLKSQEFVPTNSLIAKWQTLHIFFAQRNKDELCENKKINIMNY